MCHFSNIPPARSQELGKAFCRRHGARAARWMRTEDVGGRVKGVVVLPRRVEVFALAGVVAATVGYAWEEPPAAGETNGHIVTALATKGIDSALAAVVATRNLANELSPTS